MTDITRVHPQKAISEAWIVEALLSLMREKPYKDINVTELSERADLSRRTFYRHFKTVDEVMDFHMQNICAEFIDFTSAYPDVQKDLENVVFVHFSFWERHKNFLMLLNDNDLLYKMIQKFTIDVHMKIMPYTASRENEYVYYFITGGQWNLLVKWVEDGAVVSPEEMSKIAIKIEEHFNSCN